MRQRLPMHPRPSFSVWGVATTWSVIVDNELTIYHKSSHGTWHQASDHRDLLLKKLSPSNMSTFHDMLEAPSKNCEMEPGRASLSITTNGHASRLRDADRSPSWPTHVKMRCDWPFGRKSLHLVYIGIHYYVGEKKIAPQLSELGRGRDRCGL